MTRDTVGENKSIQTQIKANKCPVCSMVGHDKLLRNCILNISKTNIDITRIMGVYCKVQGTQPTSSNRERVSTITSPDTE